MIFHRLVVRFSSLFLTCALFTSSALAEKRVAVEVRASLPLGIAHTLLSIGGVPGFRADGLLELTRHRTYSLEEAMVLSRVKDLMLGEDRGEGSPAGALRVAGLENESVSGFLDALKDELKPDVFVQTQAAVLLLADDYQRLVWVPAQERLALERQLIEAQFSGPEASRLFTEAMAFYPGSKSESFVVGLVPLPPSKDGGASAIPLPEGVLFQVSARSLGERGGGVVFHEIVHLLQHRARQESLVETFTRVGSTQAGIELNEAVATVLGNYLFLKRVTGRAPEGTLYSDPYVEGYAQAMIPLIEDYLVGQRAFDDAFVAEAVKRYEVAYPDRIEDPDYVFRHFLLAGLDESLLPNGLEGGLQPGPPRSIAREFAQSSAPKNVPELEDNTLTRVYVLTSPDLSDYEGLIDPLGLAALQGKEAAVWAERDSKRWSFFVVGPADDPEEWMRLLKGLVSLERASLQPGLLRI